MKARPYVVVIVDLDDTRRYFTGLRDTTGARHMPTDLSDPLVMRYSTSHSASMDVVALQRDGLHARTTHEFYERPDAPRRREGARA